MFNNNLNSDKEQNIICPITQEVMKDPVIAADGITYERSAIEEWLKKSDRSPFGVVLENKNLIPNYTLKNCIQDYQKQLNIEVDLVSRFEKVKQEFDEVNQNAKKANEDSEKMKEESEKVKQQLFDIKQTVSCFELYANLSEKHQLMIASKLSQEKAQIEWDKNDDKGKYELLQTLELDKESYSFLKLDFRQELSQCTQLQRHALKNGKGMHPSTEEFWNTNPELHPKWINENIKPKKEVLGSNKELVQNVNREDHKKCTIF